MATKTKGARSAAVIGAGAAGLCAAKHLIAAGIEPVLFEVGSKIGGLWVYENDSGLSPAYKTLHCNSENRVTAYRDFPFADTDPIYPDHAGMTAYFVRYAEHYDLARRIRFNTRVTQVTGTQTEGFTVQTEDGSADRFDTVVVASGHQSVPKHPQFAADFGGEYLHSHAYRVPEPFRDKHVLVIGAGNSACDISSDICPVTASTTMVARSPVLMMPRMLFGVPTSRVLGRIEKPWMPWPIRRCIREFISWATHGRMEQWGFRTPKTQTHPAGHHLLMAQFIWGRVTAKPGIARIDGQRVHFDDGSAGEYDAMIAATGYHVELPFLSEAESPVAGNWLDLFHRVVQPGKPGLYFVGFFNVTGGGNIRMMDDQAEWVSALASGKMVPPSDDEMRQAIKDERAFVEKTYPDSPRYALELDPRTYRKQLAREFQAAQARAT